MKLTLTLTLTINLVLITKMSEKVSEEKLNKSIEMIKQRVKNFDCSCKTHYHCPNCSNSTNTAPLGFIDTLCHECGGLGYNNFIERKYCTNCSGSGREITRCNYCFGTGENVCRSHRFLDVHSKCDVCDSKRMIKCGNCVCPKCNGLGSYSIKRGRENVTKNCECNGCIHCNYTKYIRCNACVY